MLLNSTKCSSNVGKKTIQAISLGAARQLQPPYARPCDRGSSIMLSLGAKKCPPKKKLSKQAHSYKLPRLGAFPNRRLAAHTSSQSRTHKKRLQLKSHEFGNSCLEGVTLGSSKGWSPCNYIVLKLKNDPLVLLQRWQKRHQSLCQSFQFCRILLSFREQMQICRKHFQAEFSTCQLVNCRQRVN